ncbi:MAG: glycosyltransferase family 2 protein [Candidatus Micrarchaeota archaeon]
MSSTEVNIVIPMAGRGKRFFDKGYKIPKPLLEIDGKRMVEHVIKNMNVPGAKFIFLILKEHAEQYSLDKVLSEVAPGCKIILIDEVTEGAACTVLKAEEYIDNDHPLIVKDCDQIVDWVPENFFKFMNRNNADGGILTIHTEDHGFSFVEPLKKNNDFFYVNRTAEKMAISKEGATGLYYFAKGSHFVKAAKQMIRKNIRTNNEFYICPVYNEIIDDGLNVLYYPIAEMLSLGTPEDFEANKHKVKKILS